MISPRRTFGRLLVGLSRRWRRHIDDDLASLGLSDAVWAPLVHLELSGEAMRQKDLADAIGLDSSSLVRVIDVLERRGLIQRVVDPADRRARGLRLTDAGGAVVERVFGRLTTLEDGWLADVSDAEIEVVLSVFARIERRLSARPAP